MTIDAALLDRIDQDGMIDASELGFAPGHWPDELDIDGTTFYKTDIVSMGGVDFAGWEYVTRFGSFSITIINN